MGGFSSTHFLMGGFTLPVRFWFETLSYGRIVQKNTYGSLGGFRTEPLVVGRTSSRGQSGPDLVSIYPYPAYGAAVPVGSGPGGRRGATTRTCLLSRRHGGRNGLSGLVLRPICVSNTQRNNLREQRSTVKPQTLVIRMQGDFAPFAALFLVIALLPRRSKGRLIRRVTLTRKAGN